MDREEFKKTLEKTIGILVTVKKLEKTSSVNFIAQALHVKPRQVFRWLGNNANAPHDLETKHEILQRLINDSTMPLIPRVNKVVSFPFQMKIMKNSLKLTQDENGNITINGLFQLNLSNDN